MYTNPFSAATQAAINFLNQSVNQPINRGIQGFYNPPKKYVGQDAVQNAMDMIPGRSNIRGFMQGMFGQEATANPQINVGLDSQIGKGPIIKYAMDQLNEAPQATLANEAIANRQFGQNLRQPGLDTMQEVTPGKYIDTRPSLNQQVTPLDDFVQLINNARKLVRKK